jgi:enoyl-CoA hydratase/carnithine racemase
MADPATDDIVLTRRDARVLTVTLNRPAAANALSTAVIARLQAIFDAAEDDRGLGAIVLAASGRIFCAGHDLAEMRANNAPEFAKRLAVACNRMMLTMQTLPVPVIAAVQGIATAAGCQLVAAADLAVASSAARFATPGVNIGTWCSTPMVALSRAVSRKDAMRMLLTGDLMDAEWARAAGLVNEVVPPAELGARVAALAAEIAAKSPYAIALGKRAFYRQLDMDVHGAYEFASDLAARNHGAADSREGIAAFLAKRKPAWPGR